MNLIFLSNLLDIALRIFTIVFRVSVMQRGGKVEYHCDIVLLFCFFLRLAPVNESRDAEIILAKINLHWRVNAPLIGPFIFLSSRTL